MIKFRQKEFSEADAMRPFFVKLKREMNDRRAPQVQVISKNEIIPILSGNNIIIEKFVLYSKLLGKDKFRMYLRFGAKVKMPDVLKLSDFYYEDKKLLGGGKLDVGINLVDNNNNNNNNNGKKNKKKNKNFSSLFSPKFSGMSFGLSKNEKMSIGEVITYDKKSRVAVLEFDSIEKAIKSLNILPFGLNYKLYLLDV